MKKNMRKLLGEFIVLILCVSLVSLNAAMKEKLAEDFAQALEGGEASAAGKASKGAALEVAKPKVSAFELEPGKGLRPEILKRSVELTPEEKSFAQAVQRDDHMNNLATADIKNPTVQYAVLNLKPGASREEIMRAYVKMDANFDPGQRQFDEMAGMTAEQEKEFLGRVEASKKKVTDAFDAINKNLENRGLQKIRPQEITDMRMQIADEQAEQELAQAGKPIKKVVGKRPGEFAARRKWVREREMQRMLKPKANAYEILGLKSTASPQEIGTAYRKLLYEYHYDYNPAGKIRFGAQFDEVAGMKSAQQREFFSNIKQCRDNVEKAYKALQNPEQAAQAKAAQAEAEALKPAKLKDAEEKLAQATRDMDAAEKDARSGASTMSRDTIRAKFNIEKNARKNVLEAEREAAVPIETTETGAQQAAEPAEVSAGNVQPKPYVPEGTTQAFNNATLAKHSADTKVAQYESRLVQLKASGAGDASLKQADREYQAAVREQSAANARFNAEGQAYMSKANQWNADQATAVLKAYEASNSPNRFSKWWNGLSTEEKNKILKRAAIGGAVVGGVTIIGVTAGTASK